MSNLELRLAMFVHMDVPHAQITKLNAIGHVIKAYRLVLMILCQQVKTIITTQLTSSATNSKPLYRMTHVMLRLSISIKINALIAEI